ncbi:hypothetical protein HRbin40_02248 [bacterium HR40]|nr:hypothetical protein HRbin40_02248 [bacterium HR40]
MDRAVVALLFVAAASFGASPAVAGGRGPFGYWDHPMMGFGWMLGFLLSLLLLGAIVAAVIFVLRWLGIGPSHFAGSRPDPLDILKERLARGEISVAEYEERKRALGS